MKPLNFISSIIFTFTILIGGSVLAAILKKPASTVKVSTGLANEAHAIGNETAYNDLLSIELNGIRSATGKVLVMVFDNSTAFNSYDYVKAAGYQEIKAGSSTINVNFPELTDGPYALFIMHDENNDYQLNQRQGLPTEGFAISGAKNEYDEPSFKQAAVARGKFKMKLFYF